MLSSKWVQQVKIHSQSVVEMKKIIEMSIVSASIAGFAKVVTKPGESLVSWI
jgi:hypothetical protein